MARPATIRGFSFTSVRSYYLSANYAPTVALRTLPPEARLQTRC